MVVSMKEIMRGLFRLFHLSDLLAPWPWFYFYVEVDATDLAVVSLF